ncbi:hypothetical protein Cenrod_0524 [Candidatus Symbiobacter mobilis CR]|uniref:Uncharacterized protein n=1 Tax=Candidatus Symbiobacter mobilis CR TaxID=946483 RepID=U5N8P6_9BURK|nr:hypothetical protein Cenrod_0524 [Candidatus Symbiobacter mobilis CR]
MDAYVKTRYLFYNRRHPLPSQQPCTRVPPRLGSVGCTAGKPPGAESVTHRNGVAEPTHRTSDVPPKPPAYTPPPSTRGTRRAAEKAPSPFPRPKPNR